MNKKDFYRKSTKGLVIMNETHSLLPEQEKILTETYENVEILNVPARGWTLDEMKNIIKNIENYKNDKPFLDVIFVSPIPYMIMELTRKEVSITGDYVEDAKIRVRIFHNDHREKKELPNGKIIQVVAREGWQLV